MLSFLLILDQQVTPLTSVTPDMVGRDAAGLFGQGPISTTQERHDGSAIDGSQM
jgi:hypothetical protein